MYLYEDCPINDLKKEKKPTFSLMRVDWLGVGDRGLGAKDHSIHRPTQQDCRTPTFDKTT